MSGATFQINNKDNIEVLNDIDPTMLVVYKGTDADFNVQKTWPAWPEAPTVFIRPRPGVFCGGFNMYRRANGKLEMYCGGSFDYVVCCSPTSWYPGGVRTHGLETFNADGSLLFSTNSRFARITVIVPIAGPSVNNNGQIITTTSPLAGWTSMPWINVSQAGQTYSKPSGEDTGYPESFLISINSTFTQLKLTLSEVIDNYLNPLYGKTAYFPMGYIEGN